MSPGRRRREQIGGGTPSPEHAAKTPEWLVSRTSSPKDLEFAAVDQDLARSVMQRFHYLRSARTDGRPYGLFDRAGSLVVVAITSPLDVPHIHELFRQNARPSDETRVVSRVFSFEGAPLRLLECTGVEQCEPEIGGGRHDDRRRERLYILPERTTIAR